MTDDDTGGTFSDKDLERLLEESREAGVGQILDRPIRWEVACYSRTPECIELELRRPVGEVVEGDDDEDCDYEYFTQTIWHRKQPGYHEVCSLEPIEPGDPVDVWLVPGSDAVRGLRIKDVYVIPYLTLEQFDEAVVTRTRLRFNNLDDATRFGVGRAIKAYAMAEVEPVAEVVNDIESAIQLSEALRKHVPWKLRLHGFFQLPKEKQLELLPESSAYSIDEIQIASRIAAQATVLTTLRTVKGTFTTLGVASLVNLGAIEAHRGNALSLGKTSALVMSATTAAVGILARVALGRVPTKAPSAADIGI